MDLKNNETGYSVYELFKTEFYYADKMDENIYNMAQMGQLRLSAGC